MGKEQITTPKAPSPAGPYSQGIIDGNYVFVAGQRPVDAFTGEMKEGIKEQTRQVILNIKKRARSSWLWFGRHCTDNSLLVRHFLF